MKTKISNTINYLHAVAARHNTPKYVQNWSSEGAITGAEMQVGIFYAAFMYLASSLSAFQNFKIFRCCPPKQSIS